MSLVRFQDDQEGGSDGLTVVGAAPADRNPYLVYLASLAPSTRRPAAQVLGVVADTFAAGTAPEHLPWARLRYQHVQVVKTRLQERYKFTTVNRALVALRGVLRAAFNLDLMTGDELMKATSVKAARGVRVPKGRSISQDELRRLFEACDVATPVGARDAALLALLYFGGLRRHEAASLDLASFAPASDALLVLGKGNKERVVYLANGARRALMHWLAQRGSVAGPLFLPVRKGGAIQLRRLSDQSVFDIISKLAQRAGIPKVTPHDFRRTMIGDLLEHVDLATVARAVGHSSSSTTAAYDRRGELTRRRAFETLHVPFDGPA